MSREIKFIAAIDDNLGLAKNGSIPWDLPADRQYFRDCISMGPGLMGFKTFASNKHKPFPTCPRNFVATNSDKEYPGVEIVNDLKKFIEKFDENLWIIGGGQIFAQLLPYATHLYLTRVSGDFDCDTFFPEFEDIFVLDNAKPEEVENGIRYRMEIWVPKPR